MKKLTLIFLLAGVLSCFGLDEVQQYGLSDAIGVVASDSRTFSPPIRLLFFNATAGQTLTVGMAGSGTSILFTYAVAGSYLLPASVIRVYSTGTSVTGIVGLREYTGKPTLPTPSPTPTASPTPTP